MESNPGPPQPLASAATEGGVQVTSLLPKDQRLGTVGRIVLGTALILLNVAELQA